MAEEPYAGATITDSGAGIVASHLAPQLGTDPLDLAKMRYDMRRLTIIQKSDIGLILYATIRQKKSRAWGTLLDVIANWGVSVDGRGRRDIIRMEAVSKGGPASVEAEITKPGLLARTIYDRNWEEKQRKEKAL